MAQIAEIAKKIGNIVKQEGPEAPNGSQILEEWVTSASNPPAPLRAGAMGKGREGDKSPSQGLGRKGFMNLSDWLSTRPEAQGLGGFSMIFLGGPLRFFMIFNDFPRGTPKIFYDFQ